MSYNVTGPGNILSQSAFYSNVSDMKTQFSAKVAAVLVKSNQILLFAVSCVLFISCQVNE